MITPAHLKQFSETRLGKSGYLIKHPESMRLSVSEFSKESSGHSFCFSKQESLNPYSDAFCISWQLPDSIQTIGFDLPVTQRIRTQVLGEFVDWSVRKSISGYFVADARVYDWRFLATAVSQAGLDSMIALASTLYFR